MMHKKPRVLLIGALPPPFIGTSEVTRQVLHSQLLTSEFEILFLDVSDRRPLTSLGHFEYRNVVLGLKHAIQFLFLVLLKRPSVVYLGISQGLWGYLRDLCFILPAVALRRRTVIHLHGSEFDRVHAAFPSPVRALSRWALSRVSAAIVLSDRLRGVFERLVPPDRIHAVPNGIAPFPTPHPPDDGTPPRILWLSNMFARKGIVPFLRSLPRVIGAHPDVRITIAGEWESPQLRDQVMALPEVRQALPHLTFAGRVGPCEKPGLLAQHTLFVLPPLEPEGMPVSILEAMSAGIPVVSTAQGAIPDLVREGETGYLVEPTPEGIASAISRLLSDQSLRKAMGDRARAHVQSNFSEERFAQRLTDLFHQVVQNA